MEKMSHRLFALGLSATIAFFLNMELIALPVILALSYFIGSFPDMDLKWGIKHRGATHTFMFFIAMTLACTFGIYYVYYVIQVATGYAIFGVEMTFYNGIPVPSFFEKMISLDMMAVIDDMFFKMLAFFFVAFLSHFLLDMITPAGLDVKGGHVNGAIRSDNGAINIFFSLIGISMVCVSVAMMAVRMFSGSMSNWATWYFIIIGVLVSAIIIISITIGAKQSNKELRCFKIDNNIDICLPRGKCFQAGLSTDDKICNMDEDGTD